MFRLRFQNNSAVAGLPLMSQLRQIVYVKDLRTLEVLLYFGSEKVTILGSQAANEKVRG